MLFECWLQLRGEAGKRQIASIGRGRKLALTHNLGGAPGECVSLRQRRRLRAERVAGTAPRDGRAVPLARVGGGTALLRSRVMSAAAPTAPRIPAIDPFAVVIESRPCDGLAVTSPSQTVNPGAIARMPPRQAGGLYLKADLFSGARSGDPGQAGGPPRSASASSKTARSASNGEVGRHLYLVSEGAFGVFVSGDNDAHQVRVATLGRGACFGEMALLTGEPRSATVLADGDAELLRLDKERFSELVRRRPEHRLDAQRIVEPPPPCRVAEHQGIGRGGPPSGRAPARAGSLPTPHPHIAGQFAH